MFARLKNLLIRRYLKGLLDRLPGNGGKTLISILIFILASVSGYYGNTTELGSIIEYLLSILRQLEHVRIEDAALAGIAVGAVHKVLKWLDKLWVLEEKTKKDESSK